MSQLLSAFDRDWDSRIVAVMQSRRGRKNLVKSCKGERYETPSYIIARAAYTMQYPKSVTTRLMMPLELH